MRVRAAFDLALPAGARLHKLAARRRRVEEGDPVVAGRADAPADRRVDRAGGARRWRRARRRRRVASRAEVVVRADGAALGGTERDAAVPRERVLRVDVPLQLGRRAAEEAAEAEQGRSHRHLRSLEDGNR